VARTRAVVERCQRAGVAVDAELGEIGGKDGAHAPGVQTDPDEAVRFVADTHVDSLAVAVGTSHAMTDRSARVDRDLVRRLVSAAPVPLVLHSSSGLDDDELAQAVRAGLCKINIATRLNQVLAAAVRERLAAVPGLTDPRKYLGPARDAVRDEVTHLLAVLAGNRSGA
jgi:fructose-bisphosphate aldolase class II